MKFSISKTIKILAVSVWIPLCGASVEAATVNCPVDTIQAAVDSAVPGETITVTGSCTGNVLIRNEKQRIAISGSGGATVTAASSSSVVFNVRGKGITI